MPDAIQRRNLITPADIFVAAFLTVFAFGVFLYCSEVWG